MDKEEKPKPFAWLPAAMPGVARLVREKRAKVGDEHVNECFRRGVLLGEAGWFFAREGAIAIGTPWNEPAMANFGALNVMPTQSLLVMRDPEVPHAA
jgi:hypothetical protein